MLSVAVITPYFKESLDVLRQCHESVVRQSYPCLHVMVADGAPIAEISNWSNDHVILPKSHNDIGSTPRLVGAYHAIGLGVDAVAFLDADNWYRRDHIETLVRLFESTSAPFLSSSRMLCRPDGSEMAACPYTDPAKFIDTNCMMFERSGFPVLAQWALMPSYAHLIGDRVMLYYVRTANIRQAHSGETSVFYRCAKEGLYHKLGEPLPPGVGPAPDYESAFAMWVANGYPALN
jgi:glycosyltransferase involved in cell wall biosynthesis